VEHYCRREWAMHLSDVMLRRAGWHYYFNDASERGQIVAGWMQEILGWSDTTRDAELQSYQEAPAAPQRPRAAASIR
jgi:glycerol-3-phosphate dehydrogenase